MISVVIAGALVACWRRAVSGVNETEFAASFVKTLRDELLLRTSELHVVLMR